MKESLEVLLLDTNFLKRLGTALILAPLFVWALFQASPVPAFCLLFLWLGLMTEWAYLTFRVSLGMEKRILYLMMGSIYVSLGMMGFFRLMQHDFHAAIFILFCVWASDTGGYIVGRSLGGPKLCPQISPNKTWSGSGGGFVGGLFTLYIFTLFVTLEPLYKWVIVALLTSLVTQLGDLLESFVKRRFQVKDSGFILPGHGGLLDRFDGFIAAGIFCWFL